MTDLIDTVGVNVKDATRTVCKHDACSARVAKPFAALGLSGSYCVDHLKELSQPVPKRTHRSKDPTKPQQRKHGSIVHNPASFNFRALGVPNPTGNW